MLNVTDDCVVGEGGSHFDSDAGSEQVKVRAELKPFNGWTVTVTWAELPATTEKVAALGWSVKLGVPAHAAAKVFALIEPSPATWS
jgi:hypothetical protein